MADKVPRGLNHAPESAPGPLGLFASSWNRFTILSTLRSAPRTRKELSELTNVSRPTLSRILADLGDRGWIIRIDDEYQVTPLGDVIAAEIDALITNLNAAESLGSALQWIPTDLMGFDLAHLADAELLTARPEDNTGPMRQLVKHINSTEEMHVVATGVTYEVVEAICQAGATGELTIRCVLDEHALKGIRTHTDLAEKFSKMVTEGHCDAYRYDGEEKLISCNLLDDVVLFCGHSEDGLPLGILLSDDPIAHSWTAYYIDRLSAGCERLYADAFTA